jgi:hypothetical protein
MKMRRRMIIKKHFDQNTVEGAIEDIANKATFEFPLTQPSPSGEGL